MKKLLPILASAILVTACNTNPEIKTDAAQSAPQQIAPDTTGMAAFNAWKAQNELADVSSQQPQQKTVAATPKTKAVVNKTPVVKPKTKAPVSTIPSSLPKEETNSGSTAGTGNGSADNGVGETTQAEKKEGWSKAAKGAVIGGVAGAAGGAVINKKNRVLGAVIGGVVGAAGGYGIGRTMDKKDGRIEYTIPGN
jgi:hypothetical protein